MFADALTGGYIAGNTVIALILVGCVAGFVIAFLLDYNHYSMMGRFWSCVTWIVVGVLAIAIWAFSTWPFAYEYHHWINKTVKVDMAPSSRLLTDSDGNISQKFVIRSGGTYYGINDTRGALIKEGDIVHLRCKKAYDYGVPRSAHGWDCKWNGRNP